MHGKSTQNIGVLGESTSGVGVHGESATGQVGFFESGQDHNDLFLGGHVGRINTDPDDQNSDLILSANNNVDLRLDNDGGEEALFTVWGSAYEACNIRENGNLKCFGTKSAVVDTANHGARQLYALESPQVWFEDVGASTLVARRGHRDLRADLRRDGQPEPATTTSISRRYVRNLCCVRHSQDPGGFHCEGGGTGQQAVRLRVRLPDRRQTVGL